MPDCNFSDEFYDRWEHLINSVEISDVPLRHIREVNILFKDGNSVIFDVESMISNGTNPRDIEENVEDFLAIHDDDIDRVDFHINIPSIAEEVTKRTDKILRSD